MTTDAYRETPWYQRLVSRLFQREQPAEEPAAASRYTEYVRRKAAEAPTSKAEMREAMDHFREELEHHTHHTDDGRPTTSA